MLLDFYILKIVSGQLTVYPKKYAHGFVVLCFVVVMQSFIMNSHEVFSHIHQDCFAGTGAIVRLPQCQWSKPDGYGKISQCITTTKHSKAKTVCIFLGIYCMRIDGYTMHICATKEIGAVTTMHISENRPGWVKTLRPRQNGRQIADDTNKCLFLNENVWIPIKISLKFVPKGLINNIPIYR